MGWWGAVGVLWVAAVRRVPELPGPFGVPDGLLLALLAWIFTRTPPGDAWEAAVGMGGLLGWLKDLASGGPVGGWTVAFMGMAWVAWRGVRTIDRDHPISQVAWVTIFAMGATLLDVLIVWAHGDGVAIMPLLGYYLIPSALATALAGLGVFPMLRRLLATP